MENTRAYRSDFADDVSILKEAAKAPKIEDRTFYWLSRPCGTWCLKEKDVFLKGSMEYSIWTHYESAHESFRAFRVVVERAEGRKLLGKIVPFDYGTSVRRIKKAALPIMFISGEYNDGVSFSMTYAEYGSKAHNRVCQRHDGVKKCELFPENENERKLRIAQEHHSQTSKKQRVKHPKCVSR